MRIFKKKATKNAVIVTSGHDHLADNILSDRKGTIWLRNKNGIYKTGRQIEKAGKKI